jgi:hypothetical protein
MAGVGDTMNLGHAGARIASLAFIGVAALSAWPGVAEAQMDSLAPPTNASAPDDEASLPAQDPNAPSPTDGQSYSAAKRGPPPESGEALVIVGAIFTGVGAANLLTAPICKTDLVPSLSQDSCLEVELGAGGASAALGLILLVIGVSERAAYRDYYKAPTVDLAPLLSPAGGGLELHMGF